LKNHLIVGLSLTVYASCQCKDNAINIKNSVIDDCDPNPCENGGNCTDEVNTFTCDCEEDFTGMRCEESKNQLLSHITKVNFNCNFFNLSFI